MCSACGYPSAPGHWTDAGTHTFADRMRLRYIRIAAINRILAPFKLKAHDDGATQGFQISNLSGQTELVADMEALWKTASRMAGTPIDPLSDRALSHD